MRKDIKQLLAFLIIILGTLSAHGVALDKLRGKGYEIVNIENAGVRQFMADRTYDNPGQVANYGFSVVKNYSRGVSSKPAGLMLRWQSTLPAEDVMLVRVTLVESNREVGERVLDGDVNRYNPKYYYPDAESEEYLLCNMRPDVYCYYKVEEEDFDGRFTEVKRGKFYTVGQVRMLRVDGMFNVRDLGGWSTSFGVPVVYGRIFRGNRPEGITFTGKNDFVVNEEITADLDLRGSNRTVSPMGPLDEVEYYCTNNQRYKLALSGGGGTYALARDLEIIADVLRRGGNVFFHCNHGANRAGTLAFVIDGLLGLSEADLSREYELTSFAYGTSRNNTYGAMLPVIRSYGEGGDDLTQCFYNFALSIGVSEKTLDTIRCVMLGLDAGDRRITGAHRSMQE